MIQNLSGGQVTTYYLHAGVVVFQFNRGQFDAVSGAVIDINREIYASETVFFRQCQCFQLRGVNSVQTFIRRVITMGKVNMSGNPQIDLAFRIITEKGVSGDFFKRAAEVFCIGKRSCMGNHDPPFGTTAFRRGNHLVQPFALLLEVFRKIIVVGCRISVTVGGNMFPGIQHDVEHLP